MGYDGRLSPAIASGLLDGWVDSEGHVLPTSSVFVGVEAAARPEF